MNKTDVITALDTLLEHEREALVGGDLEQLVALLERKRTLIDTLNTFGVTQPSELQRLQGKAARNQVLLDSALSGIRSVSVRIATLQKVRRSLETYDQGGNKTTILTSGPKKLEKRA